ncbi:MAG: flagellar basal-body MS-ring/collar protein FliF [Pirellulaceae bacterium]
MMQFLRDTFQQLYQQWQSATIAMRIIMAITAIVTVLMTVGVAYWASRPQYIVLAQGLAPADAAEIVAKLDSGNIRYQLSFSGSSILVDKRQLSTARLAVGDMIAPLPSADLDTDGGILSGDPSDTHVRHVRFKERMIREMLIRIEGIADASVQLSVPEPSPFLLHRSPPTASVVLHFRPGFHAKLDKAHTVANLVAKSVPGLDETDVVVADSTGRQLVGDDSFGGTDLAGQAEYRAMIEADTAEKALATLRNMQGVSRSIVKVSAVIDFKSTSTEITRYDAKNRTVKSESTSTTKSKGYNHDPSGIAGVGSNPPNQQAVIASGTPLSEHSSETLTNEFEPSKEEIVTKEVPGQITRLSIAAIVDLTPRPSSVGSSSDPAANNQPAPKTPTLEEVRELIKSAVNFDEERGDQIEVVEATLLPEPQPSDMLVTLQNRDFYNQLIRNGSLGIASLVALVLGLMTLRKLKPIAVPQPVTADNSERLRAINELSQQARQHPEAIQAIISSWLRDDDDGTTTAVRRAA